MIDHASTYEQETDNYMKSKHMRKTINTHFQPDIYGRYTQRMKCIKTSISQNVERFTIVKITLTLEVNFITINDKNLGEELLALAMTGLSIKALSIFGNEIRYIAPH